MRFVKQEINSFQYVDFSSPLIIGSEVLFVRVQVGVRSSAVRVAKL